MKILFITDNFPPEFNAPARRTFEHCKHWVDNGEEVTVITCFPNYPRGKVFEGYKNRLYDVEYIEGIKVIRIWSFIAANEGFFKRIFDHISFAKMAIFASFFIKRPDVIVATSPQFFTAIAGRFISLFKRRPWIMEVRDLWPESIAALGLIRRGGLYSILERIELSLYGSAKKVIVVTDSFKDNLVKRNIHADKIEVIKNGIDHSIFNPKKLEPIQYPFSVDNKFIVGYIGTHGLAHNLSFVLDCAEQLQNKADIHFILIGEGAQKKSLISKAKIKEIKNISFLDSIAKTDVVNYISSLNVALIPLKKSETFKSVLPSKIFENAAMGIPILLGVEGEAKELVKKYNAGLTYEPESESDFIKKLLNIYNNTELQKELSLGGKNLARDFDRKKLANEMLDILYDV